MSLFHTSQQRVTIWSQYAKTLLDYQLSRINYHMFSTGFSSGDLRGIGRSVMLGEMSRLAVVGHPA